MLTTQIRLATAEDALAIHELHTASVKALCKGAYSLEIIDGWLKGRSPDGYKGIAKGEMYVIESDGRIMGFSHVVPGEIIAIFIHPDVARHGVGSTLVQHGISKAKINWDGPVKVVATLNAQPFYEKHGFTKTGTRVVQRNNIAMPIIEMELKSNQAGEPVGKKSGGLR